MMRPPADPYNEGLKLLSFRARSVAELRRRLLRSGAPAPEVERALDRLLAQKLLNDASFAQQLARTMVVSRGASRRRILQELARRGVAREVADRAIDGLRAEEGIDAAAALHRVAEKKWRSLSKLDDGTRRRRLYAFLARRGFDSDEILGAINALARASHE